MTSLLLWRPLRILVLSSERLPRRPARGAPQSITTRYYFISNFFFLKHSFIDPLLECLVFSLLVVPRSFFSLINLFHAWILTVSLILRLSRRSRIPREFQGPLPSVLVPRTTLPSTPHPLPTVSNILFSSCFIFFLSLVLVVNKDHSSDRSKEIVKEVESVIKTIGASSGSELGTLKHHGGLSAELVFNLHSLD
jgi:hypothetical protein